MGLLYLLQVIRCTFVFLLFEANEMGGACGAYGGGERCAQGSGWET